MKIGQIDNQLDYADLDLNTVIKERSVAESRLNNAISQNEIDAAILDLQAVELKLRALILRRRAS